MRRTRKPTTWPTLVAAAALAVVFSSFVLAGPEGAANWPGDITVPGGPTALQRLTEIHDSAITALPGALPETRDDIVRVLHASFICAAYDGVVPVGDPPPDPLPPHAEGHVGAAAKVESAYQALHSPPAPPEHPDEWQDWKRCADDLEHGH